MSWERDGEFTEYKIEEIRTTDRGFEIGLTDGGWIFATNEHETTPPKVGETARLFGKGFGCIVRGIVVSGRCYRYETKSAERTRFDQELLDSKNKRQKELDDSRADRDAKRANFPPEFQARFEGFESRNKNFRRDHEPYELFVCEQAVYMVVMLKTAEEIEKFQKLEYEEQRSALRCIGRDHSGNTWGAALRLAWLFVTTPENVERQHGALCPLVGCKEYGCYVLTEDAA